MAIDNNLAANRSLSTATPSCGAVDNPAEPGPSIRLLLLWVTLGYTAFVIYGSLVPLHFRPQPLSAAWAQFQRIPYLDLGIGSRADWVANILLFVPLAYCWHSLLWPPRGRATRVLVSILVLCGCLALSIAVEFAQLFFPPRTVSLNDVIAEAMGALIGTVLWWGTGTRVVSWLAGWARVHTPTGMAERLLYVYLFLLFGYNVMPLDLTISGVEIYHKWRDGRILLVPFSAAYDTWAQRAYALAADSALWIPAAFLWRLASARPTRTVVLYVVACAAVIEILQLFVFSRVTSTTDLLTTGCGAAIGAMLAGWLRPGGATATTTGTVGFAGTAALAWGFAIAAWLGVLMTVFWYPFDFNTEWGFVHGRLATLRRAPFEAYYFGTEFRALTEVFHKTGFFFPLGALLAIGVAAVTRRLPVQPIWLHAFSALLIAAAAAGIEAGQLLLPGKNADPTDWLLEVLGGLAGYVTLRMLHRSPHASTEAARPRAQALPRLGRRGQVVARGVAVMLGALILLVPVAPDTVLLAFPDGWRVRSLGAYPSAVASQGYLVLKSLILWVPLGMLFAFVRKEGLIKSWTRGALMAFLLLALPWPGISLSVQDVVEVLGAYWGVRVGIWLGAQVLRAVPEPIAPAAMAHPADASAALRSATMAPTTRPATALSVVSPVETVATHPAPRVASDTSGGTAGAPFARRGLAVALLLGVAAWAWVFPRWGVLLLGGLVLYALVLWRWRHAWLLVVPAALPLLNLAPGTGRFFFDEFDLVMITTVAMALWHGGGPAPRPRLAPPVALSLALFGCSVAVSLVIGLLPLSPLDANAFTNYWSHYNSLRVAKGLVWALPLLAVVLWTLTTGSGLVMRLFVPGMWLGLAGVVAVGLRERALFADLTDLSVPYRITATFSAMHTGGSEIETYIVTAIPFLALALGREWPVAVRFVGLALLVLAAYLMTLTIARAGVLALGVALGILLLGAWRASRHRPEGKRVIVAGAVAVLGVAAALGFGMSGGYLQQRIAGTAKDWTVRVDHWRAALAIRDDDLTTTVLGMGLGRFPETYLYHSAGASLPGTYRLVDEHGNRHLALGGGETLYMAQRVPVADQRRYTLSLRVRSSQANARLGVPVCEKHLLDSRRCVWQVLDVPGDGNWHERLLVVDTGTVGAGNWLTRRPVEISLFNDTPGTRVDVDDVQLRDAAGAALLHNGDFSAGLDHWFFKTHSHLPWHIKNLWVAVLFEQGWFGLIAFSLLICAVVVHLAGALWRGDRFAGVLLAATGGFLTVGAFGSLFDTARIATLFFVLVVVAGTTVGVDGRADARP